MATSIAENGYLTNVPQMSDNRSAKRTCSRSCAGRQFAQEDTGRAQWFDTHWMPVYYGGAHTRVSYEVIIGYECLSGRG